MLAAALLALPLAAARAQESDELIGEDLVADGAAEQFTVVGAGGFVYQGNADIDGGGSLPDSLQVYRYDLGLGGRTELVDRLHWGNTFFFGANDYDFNTDGFSATAPWNTILNMRLGTKLTYDLTEVWGLSVGGVFMFSPETGADWGNSIIGGGLVAAEYRHSKAFFASLGVTVLSQIEDDPIVTPAVAVNWLPAEDWTVRVGSVPTSGGAAAAAEASYRIIEPIELGLAVLYQQRRFRLDGSGRAPDGVGQDNSLPVRFRVGWNINDNISLNGLGGVVLAGNLELDNQNGRQIASEDYDPAAYVGLRLVGAF